FGRGELDLHKHVWSLRVDARGGINRPPPLAAADAPEAPEARARRVPFDLLLDSRGDWSSARVNPLLVHLGGSGGTGGGELRVTGDYDAKKPKPLALTIALSHQPQDV